MWRSVQRRPNGGPIFSWELGQPQFMRPLSWCTVVRHDSSIANVNADFVEERDTPNGPVLVWHLNDLGHPCAADSDPLHRVMFFPEEGDPNGYSTTKLRSKRRVSPRHDPRRRHEPAHLQWADDDQDKRAIQLLYVRSEVKVVVRISTAHRVRLIPSVPSHSSKPRFHYRKGSTAETGQSNMTSPSTTELHLESSPLQTIGSGLETGWSSDNLAHLSTDTPHKPNPVWHSQGPQRSGFRAQSTLPSND